jgi:hypothetical protein
LEEPPLAIPGADARLEQWLKPAYGSANEGRGPRQVWLVSERTKESFQLPDFAVPTFPGSGPGDEKITVDTTGHVSNFSFSPNGNYLFRSQKLLLGVTGAYLYFRKDGFSRYEMIMPDLFLRASEFFMQKTGTQLKDGAGVVELAGWGPNNTLILALRDDRDTAASAWRCVFDPVAKTFSASTNSAAPAAKGPGLSEMKPQDAERLQKWLATQPRLHLATLDQSKRRSIPPGFTGVIHPFYVTGDFNKDGVEDFVVKLVSGDNRRNQLVAVFNGSSAAESSIHPNFTKDGFDDTFDLVWAQDELSISDGGHYFRIKPSDKTYITEEGADE